MSHNQRTGAVAAIHLRHKELINVWGIYLKRIEWWSWLLLFEVGWIRGEAPEKLKGARMEARIGWLSNRKSLLVVRDRPMLLHGAKGGESVVSVPGRVFRIAPTVPGKVRQGVPGLIIHGHGREVGRLFVR